MPARLVWSAERDRALLHAHARGDGWRAIAQSIGCSRCVVVTRARQLGVVKTTRRQQPIGSTVLARMILGDAEAEPERPPLPAGHSASWDAITAGTCLEGAAYPYPVFS